MTLTNKPKKELDKRFKRINKFTPYYDNMDQLCCLFMRRVRQEFFGKKAEISAHNLNRLTAQCAKAFGIEQAMLMMALLKRGWFEPSAADTYLIRYDLMRK